LNEVGFELRSKAPAALPPLIPGIRRDFQGRALSYRIPATRVKPKPASLESPEPKRGKP